MNAEAQVLDVRDPAEFAGQHLTGSVNIGLSGAYATWAGTVLDLQQPIVILANPRQEEEAAMRLGRIGFDRIAGFLEGGAPTLGARPELTRALQRVTASVCESRAGRPNLLSSSLNWSWRWRVPISPSPPPATAALRPTAATDRPKWFPAGFDTADLKDARALLMDLKLNRYGTLMTSALI